MIEKNRFLEYLTYYKERMHHYNDDLFIIDENDKPKGIVVHGVEHIQEYRAILYELRQHMLEAQAAKDYFIVCDLSCIKDANIKPAAIILDKMGANAFLLDKKITEMQPNLITDIEDISKMPVMEYEGKLVGTKTLELYYGTSRFITEEAHFTQLPTLPSVSLISMDFPERREHRNKFAHTSLLCSTKKFCKLGTKHAPQIIAENFNISLTPELLDWFKDKDYDKIIDFCKTLSDYGAGIINLSLQPEKIALNKADIKIVLSNILPRINDEVDAFLAIECRDYELLEWVLQEYPGRILINSVINDDIDQKTKYKWARLYGAALVFMPVNKKHLPMTAEERCVIVKEMIISARSKGLKASDFVLDPVMLPIKHNDIGARETLKTLALYKETFNLPTILGLRNIAYESDNKVHLQKLYLAMLLSQDLSMPILDVENQELITAFDTSYRLLACNK